MQKIINLNYTLNDWGFNFFHQFAIKINATTYTNFYYSVVSTPSTSFEVQRGATTYDTVTNIKAYFDALIISLGLTSKITTSRSGSLLQLTVGEVGDTVEVGFLYTITNNGIVPSVGGYTGGTYQQAELFLADVEEEVVVSVTPTVIDNANQITFCNSPINIVVSDAQIESVELFLWIWNGDLNQTLGDANYRFKSKKIASSDTYIAFEISEYIKSFLVAPPNAPNTSQPTFVYNELSNPAITGQAVFWQVQALIETSTTTILQNYNTNVATLGYKWADEQTYTATNSIVAGGSLNFEVARNKWYNPKIHNYIAQSFDLTQPLVSCTSANVIKVDDVVPPANYKRCSLEPVLVVYLNKIGLFETFTTHGKVAYNEKIENEMQARLYRNPALVDNSFMHSKVKDNFNVTESFTINTGALTEEMVAQVEEIIYSPKVYLVFFKGDVHTTTTVGITIDNNYITIDSLNTTIDGLSVGEEYLSFFKTHKQVPVIVTNSDFQRKTRLNDKKDINFNIVFERTTNKINDIR